MSTLVGLLLTSTAEAVQVISGQKSHLPTLAPMNSENDHAVGGTMPTVLQK